MFQSMTDGPIWEKEFALLVDQEHFEKVWGIMLPNVEQYADSFLTSISNFGNQGVMEYAYSAFVQELIEKNDKRSEKYHDIFDLDLFEDEYEMDKDDFKNTTLKKECDVINKTLPKSFNVGLGDYLHALNPNRSLPRNKKGLKRLLNVDI